ncbi:AAA domain-containing protein [Clostridium butyricum]|uniref:bifunctional RecB family nuclease/DEAD/DEAH box helicase n=1 Tax=Clostridium butyricum TaxID=1492 RepID=UPI00374F1193
MLHISPSKTGRYFYYQCARYLLFSTTRKEERKLKGYPEISQFHTKMMASIFKKGYEWEETVVSSKLKDRAVISIGTQNLCERVFDENETIEKLKCIEPNKYLYQPTFITPYSFYEEYGLDPNLAQISMCRPDLIFVDKDIEGKRIFRIIDVKSSAEMKLSHKIQIVFYALILKHILLQYKIEGTVDINKGGVWIYGADEPEWFDMSVIHPHMEQFLSVSLNEFAAGDCDNVPWHLYFRCEWCEYYEYCRKKAEETKNISLIPYLTVSAKQHLKELGIENLNDMKRFLLTPHSDKLLAQCASLDGKKERLLSQVDALLNNTVYTYGSSSVSMPINENIRVLITIQREAISGELYSIGLLRTGGEGVFENHRDEQQWVAESKHQCPEIKKSFINFMYDMCSTINDFNSNVEWKQKLTLQTYVLDYAEIQFLHEILIEGLDDTDIKDRVLNLLFYFHSEELLNSEEHSEYENHFPVVVLTSVVRDIFALPFPITYKLEDIVKIFPIQDQKVFDYQPSPYFQFRLSNAFRSDVVVDLWNKNNGEQKNLIIKELRARLWAMHNLIFEIRNKVQSNELNQPVLFAWPPKFHFPEQLHFSDSTLSKLAFITRYESVLSYVKVKEGRALPRDERKELKRLFVLTALDNDNNEFIVESDDLLGELEKGDWLFTQDTLEGERQQMIFKDYLYKNKFYGPSNSLISYVMVEEILQYNDKNHYRLKLKWRTQKNIPSTKRNSNYLIQPRFIDWNSNKVIERLGEIDKILDKRIEKLLHESLKYNKEISDVENLDINIKSMMKVVDFKDSQKQAFQHFIHNTLTLIWGPPGSGKTYFLAGTLLCWLEHCRIENIQCRILISAFTHAAIENCLKKVVDMNKEIVWKENNIYKLDSLKVFTNGIQSINTNDCNYKLKENRCIIGATVYAIEKVLKTSLEETPFDVVVIDEGSQMRISDSLLAISRLKENGRLLIAGDDRQLPPITNGEYPKAEDGNPSLYGSIFEFIHDADFDNRLTCMLKENFRMNDVLCAYPALKLYHSEYKSVDDNIANQKIRLNFSSTSNSMIDDMIDPEYPFVVCVLEGLRRGIENEVEATLVADVVEILRQRLCQDDSGFQYPNSESGDIEFWKKGLSVISPHRKQIRMIKKHLAERGLRPPFSVNTVDKMQGQECDAVIVSYGVADPERAIREGRFIYSLNRLNVAITRARSKCIVFLPKPLLNPSLEIFGSKNLEEGVAFMIGLEKYASENGICKEYSIDENSNIKLKVFRLK